MILWALAAVAEAGCTVDTGREARQAAAELVVVGTIVGMELAEVDGAAVLYERLRIDEAFEGRVVSGEILLRTGIPDNLCPSDRVFAPGAKVWAIGTPGADHAIAVSSCQIDVGESDGDVAWLADVAARSPSRSVFPGASPRAATPYSRLPRGNGQRVRATAPQGVFEGALVRDEGADVSALFEVDDLLVLDRVPEAWLQRVMARPAPIAPGAALMWLPGLAVGPSGEVSVEGDVEAEGVVDAAVTADRWTPQRPARPAGSDLYAPHPTALRATPGGPDLALVRYAMLIATGPAVDGWRPVWVDTEGLAGAAWVADADVQAGGRGYGSGSGSGSGVWLEIPAGVEIRAPSGPELAITQRDTRLPWLATAGDRAWIVVPAPSGPRVGEIRCDRAAFPEGCDPR